MPVIDHEVHALTRQCANARYGCHNRDEFRDAYLAQDREYSLDGHWRSRKVWVHHTMSTDCRYDMSLLDAKCDGCKYRGQGEAYAAKVMESGK